MSRTRSGLLDRIDITGIKDSEDEDNMVEAVHSNQPRSLEEAQKEVGGNGKASILRSFAANENKKGEDISSADAAAAINTTALQNSQVYEGSAVPSLIENSTKNYRNNFFESHVCRPVVPSISPEPTTNGGNSNSNGNDGNNNVEDEDAIEIIGESNPGTNPLLDFPHRREDCQRFGFASHPERFCRFCFCYICDIPASECVEWNVSVQKHDHLHCVARHSDAKSRQKRRSVQIRKNTLRPRKRILLPHRLRSSPKNATRTKNASGGTKPSEKTETSISSRPPPSVPMPISRTLRSRKRLLPPIRLRSPEYVSGAKKQSERIESSISSPPRPPSPSGLISRTFQHDLFLPGRGKQPNFTPATTKATKTTQSDRYKGTLTQSTSFSFRKNNSCKARRASDVLGKTKPSTLRPRPAVVVSAHRAAKGARRSDSPSRRRSISCSMHFPVASSSRAPTAPKSMKRKPESATTSSQAVTIDDASTTQTPMATAHSKTMKLSTRPSHYTRSSSNSANASKEPEIFGTLGAYWRGEPTKYAGVPYQIRTTNNNDNNTRRGTTAIPKTEIKPLTSQWSIAGEATTFSPKRPRIQKRRILLPLSYARNIGAADADATAGATTSEESKASTPNTMPEVSNHNGGVGPTPLNNPPGKQTIAATLEGTISFDSNSQRYSILGSWYCPWSKSFPPQKFGLVRSLRGGEEGPDTKGSSMNGTFDGYCVVTTMSLDDKGDPSYRDRLVFEKHVKLEFRSSLEKGGGNTNAGTLEVWGSGANKFGPFVTHGMAKPCTSEKNNNILYTIVLQKRYLTNKPLTNKQQNTAAASRVHETPRPTRSNIIHGNGTIVRKKFGNGNYCEGEVVGYDPIQKYYMIKYTDGNHDAFDEADIKRYYKHLQRYSNAPYAPKALAVREKLSHSMFVDNIK